VQGGGNRARALSVFGELSRPFVTESITLRWLYTSITMSVQVFCINICKHLARLY